MPIQHMVAWNHYEYERQLDGVTSHEIAETAPKNPFHLKSKAVLPDR